jgi:prefoldin subunit 5
MTSIEENMRTSFSYVKKDLIAVNDSINDLHNKISHLSMNHASLLSEMAKLKEQIAKLSGKKKKK